MRLTWVALLALGCGTKTGAGDSGSTGADGGSATDGGADDGGADGGSGDGGEDCGLVFHVDADADGFGDPDLSEVGCAAPAGMVSDGSDCDDADPDVFPGSHATEIPGDGVDTDCDGLDVCTDLNCDGWADIVFAQTDFDGVYDVVSAVYLGGDAGYGPEPSYTLSTVGAMGVDAGDLDGDGYVDLAFAAVQDGENRRIDSRLHFNGPAGFNRSVDLPTIGCSDPTIADVDQDGWPDVLFSNRYSGGDFSVEGYENDSYVYLGGAGGFSVDDRIDLPTVGAARSRVADLDHDGYQDIVFANGVMDILGVTESWIYWGGADGWSVDARTALPTAMPEGLLVDDLNGDGELDILFTTWMCFLTCDGVNRVYWGDGTRDYTFDRSDVLDGAEGGVDAQLADLDGDGAPELVVANGAVDFSGAYATESWVYTGGAGFFTPDDRVTLPTTAASECGVADLDEDGHPDVVCASHYAPEDGTPEVSQIYWGAPTGPDASRVTELPTRHAAGMVIVGG